MEQAHINTYRFYQEGSSWYIDLPGYLAQGGSKGDLLMVAGADTMLFMMAEGDTQVFLTLSASSFNGSDELLLDEVCSPEMGGGYYLMPWFEGKQINQRMWLCGVTEFVFGGLPERIFVRKERV